MEHGKRHGHGKYCCSAAVLSVKVQGKQQCRIACRQMQLADSLALSSRSSGLLCRALQ
jgi:hypothetical protein